MSRGRAGRRASHSAGPETSAAAPSASAATPRASSATPPSRASPAPVRPLSRSLKPISRPRSEGACCRPARRWPPRTRSSSRGRGRIAPPRSPRTLSIHRSEITDSAISTRPPDSATLPSDPVDDPAHHQHQRVHADHVRADDREHVVGGVVLVVHHDRAGERHDADHHAEARLRGQQRRDHPGPRDDLAQRHLRRGRRVARVEQLRDPLRVRPHQQHQHQRHEHEAAPGQPERRERVPVEVACRGAAG